MEQHLSLDLKLKNVDAWGGVSHSGKNNIKFKSSFGLASVLSILDSLNLEVFALDVEKQNLYQYLKASNFVISYYKEKPADIPMYPADWDDISLGLIAVKDFVKILPFDIVALLSSHYSTVGAFYTWLGIDAEQNNIDIMVNINLFRLLIRYGVVLKPLFNWILMNFSKQSVYYPMSVNTLIKILFLLDVQKYASNLHFHRSLYTLLKNLAYDNLRNQSAWDLLSLKILGNEFSFNNKLDFTFVYGYKKANDSFEILSRLFEYLRSLDFKDRINLGAKKQIYKSYAVINKQLYPSAVKQFLPKFEQLDITDKVAKVPFYIVRFVDCKAISKKDLQNISNRSVYKWFWFWLLDNIIDRRIYVSKEVKMRAEQEVREFFSSYATLKRDSEHSVLARLAPFYAISLEYFYKKCPQKKERLDKVKRILEKYLLLRQINDDLHDFWTDFKEEKETLATSLYFKVVKDDNQDIDTDIVVSSVFTPLFKEMKLLTDEIAPDIYGLDDLAKIIQALEDWDVLLKDVFPHLNL